MNELELVNAYGGSAIIVDPPAPPSLPGYRRCLGAWSTCDTLIPEPRRYCRFCLGTLAGMGRAPAMPGPGERREGG